MIEQTEAVVLKTRRFSESSKIVTFYTKNLGKISALAKGALRAKSKYGAVLQPISHVSTVIYVKHGRELQNLAGAESLHRYPHISSSLERLSAAMEIVELVDVSVHGEDRNDVLYDALIEALPAVNDPELNESLVVVWFMVRLAEALGYAIHTEGCGVCGESMAEARAGVPWSVASGAPLCEKHRESAGVRILRPESFHLLQVMPDLGAPAAASLEVSERIPAELRETLQAFLRYHVDGLRRLRVGEVTSSLLK